MTHESWDISGTRITQINSGYTSCYPKFLNEIWVSGISCSGSGILGLGYWFFAQL